MRRPEAPAPLSTPQVLSARYRLVRFIARGGMAEVWEGHDQILSRAVAVKVLQPQYATDEVFLQRFRREAVAAARLAHPGVVATYDAGVDGTTTYIVMELVRGDTLRHFLSQRGALPPALAVEVAAQITEALVHAHRAGVIHRDIKPANILLCSDEEGRPRVKVTDFGIAKAAEGLGLDLTTTGLVLGTPRYLSPEQVRGEEPDARADLYALGVVLFEALTGHSPFRGETEMAMAMARLNQPAPHIRQLRPDLPPALDAVVDGLLATDRAQRIPSALALRDRLAALRGTLDDRTAGLVGTTAVPAQTGGTWPGAAAGATLPDAHRSRAEWTALGPPSTGQAPTARGAPGLADARPGAAGGPPPGWGPPPSAVEPSRRRTRRHAGRIPGAIVGALAVAGVVVAALLVGSGHHRNPGTGGAGGSATPIPIATVKVVVFPPMHSADNPGEAANTHDGNANTAWSTDRYLGRNFGGLGGQGLAIELSGAHVVHTLTVTSSTQGWSARTYVANRAGTGALSEWGSPTATKTNIGGSTTFSLGGQKGSWVLLWLTDTGPSEMASINELTVS